MALPGFQDLMLPLLRLHNDGEEHLSNEFVESLADELNLGEEERNALLPSGRQAVFANRVGWARSYLKNSGLILYTGRKRSMITERGRQVLVEAPLRIDINYLSRFPEFVEFRGIVKKGVVDPLADKDEGQTETPLNLCELRAPIKTVARACDVRPA